VSAVCQYRYGQITRYPTLLLDILTQTNLSSTSPHFRNPWILSVHNSLPLAHTPSDVFPFNTLSNQCPFSAAYVDPNNPFWFRMQCKISCFYGNELLYFALPPRWRTTPCLPSPTWGATYSKLPSIPGRCFLHLQPEEAPRRGEWDPQRVQLGLSTTCHCIG